MTEFTADPSGDLSLMVLVRFLGRHKTGLAVWVIAFSVAATLLAFVLTPKYRAEIVVAPAEGSSNIGDLGGLGGLASLAGINIGGAGKKGAEALEFLKSRAFAAGFIQRHALLPVLFANKWDAGRHTWRDADDIPTLSEGVQKFTKKVTQIVEDKRSGIVTISVIWTDRAAAAEWANAFVAEADQSLRDRAVAEQGRSIEYLRSEAAQTSTVEIGNAISKLTETELKNAMVAKTRDAYAFKVVDPAVVPDPKERYSPNKPLIVVMGAFLGFGLGVIAAAMGERRRGRR